MTETWLSDCIFDNEILPCNYTLFRKDRPSRGGGVLIAVNNNISCQRLNSPKDLEIICIKSNLKDQITVCVTYVPPNSTTTYCDNLFSFLYNLLNDSGKLIVLGDFNFPDIDWDTLSGHSPVSNQFCDLMFRTGLSQLINVPTHNHGNILDLLLTNLDDYINHLQIYPDPLLQSDHYIMTFSIYISVTTSSKSAAYFTFNFSKGDYQGLCNHDSF